MFTLKDSQRIVEELYYDTINKADYDDDSSCRILRDRIKKNLRLILSDIIILNKLQGNTPV